MDFNLSKVPIIVCALQVSTTDPAILFENLNDQEKARALRFRQAKDYERFVAAHSLKRALLGKFLDELPVSLTFDLGFHGKPFCRHPQAPYFNISHSGDWVVIGFSLLSEIGVDIEFSRGMSCQGLADRVCNASQIKHLEIAEFSEEMFLLFWTQKEAIAKACGKGIAVGLPDIPGSGCLGKDEVMFLQQRYYLWTYRWAGEGIMSVASSVIDKPRFFIARQTTTEIGGVKFSLQESEV